MKKLWNTLVLALAVNFLALAGGVGYLFQTHRLDKEKALAIRELLFPKVVEPVATTQPAADPTTQPVLSLEEFLATQTGRPAAEQVQSLQRTFDSRLAQLDRRQREVESLHDLVKAAERKVAEDRLALEKNEQALKEREEEAAKLAGDKGFQDSIQLYQTLKPKQVKDIFTSLPDEVAVRYLRAMEPRAASKILKEFKAPAELERVTVLMELLRTADPADQQSADAGASAKE